MQQVLDSGNVDSGYSVMAKQRGSGLEGPNHLGGIDRRQRWNSVNGVAEQLARDPVKAKGDDRAESGILTTSDDQRHAGRSHHLDDGLGDREVIGVGKSD